MVGEAEFSNGLVSWLARRFLFEIRSAGRLNPRRQGLRSRSQTRERVAERVEMRRHPGKFRARQIIESVHGEP